MIAEQPDKSSSRIEPARIDNLNGDLPDLIVEDAAMVISTKAGRRGACDHALNWAACPW